MYAKLLHVIFPFIECSWFTASENVHLVSLLHLRYFVLPSEIIKPSSLDVYTIIMLGHTLVPRNSITQTHNFYNPEPTNRQRDGYYAKQSKSQFKNSNQKVHKIHACYHKSNQTRLLQTAKIYNIYL